MTTMEWALVRPTGRRFVCATCLYDVAEVPTPTGPQLALHYFNGRVCESSGWPSERHGVLIPSATETKP